MEIFRRFNNILKNFRPVGSRTVVSENHKVENDETLTDEERITKLEKDLRDRIDGLNVGKSGNPINLINKHAVFFNFNITFRNLDDLKDKLSRQQIDLQASCTLEPGVVGFSRVLIEPNKQNRYFFKTFVPFKSDNGDWGEYTAKRRDLVLVDLKHILNSLQHARINENIASIFEQAYPGFNWLYDKSQTKGRDKD